MLSDGATRSSILTFAAETYQTVPDYPWERTPDCAVLRCKNGKWYALIMPIPRSKLGLPEDTVCDVMNLKCDPLMLGSVLMQKGFFPAYHMNKNHWLTVLLDGSVPASRVIPALQMSYALVCGKQFRKAPADLDKILL